MPKRPEGVYSDWNGGWYFKVTVGADPLTGKRNQTTRRGFTSATEAASARRDYLSKVDNGTLVQPLADR